MDAFGIFEGGGAKGLAHVGALRASEEAGIRFLGVAGTSVGAIVAGLVAAGYSADELYSPENPKSIFHRDFLDFFDGGAWKNLKELQGGIKSSKAFQFSTALWTWSGRVAIAGILVLATVVLLQGPVWNWAAIVLTTLTFASGLTWACLWSEGVRVLVEVNGFLFAHRRALSRLCAQHGILDTASFEAWLDGELAKKLKASNPDFVPSGDKGAVAFRDLQLPLKVIAADVKFRRMRVFGIPSDAHCSVSSAIGASISIPFVFLPKRESPHRYVDGGIVSNFPAWVFDAERNELPPLTPTIGFRLVEDGQTAESASPRLDDFMAHVSDVFMTAVFGDNSLERRDVATLHEVPLQVSIGPLDFHVSDDRKKETYRYGKLSAKSYFDLGHVWRHPASHIQKILKVVDGALRQQLSHQGHLRLNVMLPISHDQLQVIYSYNMDSDDDCDDQLKFKMSCGACGLCWERLDYVVCDLNVARSTYADAWRMDKWQQRLVRNSLRSLLCVPLFDQSKLAIGSEDRNSLERAFVGVLNIDSDEDILNSFDNLVRNGDEDLKSCAALVATYLTKPYH